MPPSPTGRRAYRRGLSRRRTGRRNAPFSHTSQHSFSPLPLTRARSDDGDADKYFRPFQLACDVKTPKLRTTALDYIEKMIGARALVVGGRKGAPLPSPSRPTSPHHFIPIVPILPAQLQPSATSAARCA
jgi:hypothetical protein